MIYNYIHDSDRLYLFSTLRAMMLPMTACDGDDDIDGDDDGNGGECCDDDNAGIMRFHVALH